MGTFVIEPDVPFSLSAAASFGFGPNMGRPKSDGDLMRLAFVLDGYTEHAGVVLRQRADGAIDAEVEGTRKLAAVERQVRRILSLDHPARSPATRMSTAAQVRNGAHRSAISASCLVVADPRRP